MHDGGAVERFSLLKARGALPHGNVGRSDFDLLTGEVAAFAAEVRRQSSGMAELPPLRLDERIDNILLSGAIDGCYSSQRLAYRFASATPGDFLSVWLPHLLLNASTAPGYPAVTVFIGKDGAFRLDPVVDAKEELRKLCELFRQGLCAPLSFFPKSSYALRRRRW